MTPEEITNLVKTVFDNPKGQKLLDYLDTVFGRPSYQKGRTLDEVAFEAGRQDVLNQLKKELNV